MIPAPDAARAYELALADFREACADLDGAVARIADTARHLGSWSHGGADALHDGLPPDWPDLQRLVSLIAAVRRGREAAHRAWLGLPPADRASLAPPEPLAASRQYS